MITQSSKQSTGTSLKIPLAGFLLASAALASANAQPSGGDGGASLGISYSAESSYTAGGDVKFSGAKFGESDALSYTLGVGARVPIDGRWSIPVDFRSQNVELGDRAGAPLPGYIHTASLGAGLAYRANEHWSFSARVSPTLYKFSDIGGNDLGFSGGLFASWRRSPTVRWIFGALIAPDSDLKFLPVAGVEWDITDRWELSVAYPRPRLTYKCGPQWSFYGGVDATGATFRASDHLGSSIGLARFNDALGSYRDVRLGLGVAHSLAAALKIEMDAGYSVYRRIDFTRLDEEVRFDPAPYIRLGLAGRF